MFTTDILFPYFKEFYNPYISMSVVENIKGNLYIRFSELTIPLDRRYIDVGCFIKRNDEITSISGVNSLYDVKVNISSEDAKNYEDLLVNVYLEDGTIHTYGLNFKGNEAQGTVLCTEDTWNLDSTKWLLIGKGNDKEYYILSDISECIDGIQ